MLTELLTNHITSDSLSQPIAPLNVRNPQQTPQGFNLLCRQRGEEDYSQVSCPIKEAAWRSRAALPVFLTFMSRVWVLIPCLFGETNLYRLCKLYSKA